MAKPAIPCWAIAVARVGWGADGRVDGDIQVQTRQALESLGVLPRMLMNIGSDANGSKIKNSSATA